MLKDNINVFESKNEASQAAAEQAANLIKRCIEVKGKAVVVLATGMTYIDTYQHMIKAGKNIDWTKVEFFHLDEYVGISSSHKGSFKKYIQDNVANIIGEGPVYNYIEGSNNPHDEVKRLNNLLENRQIDLLFAGIGNNGHLAFNEPPADFNRQGYYFVSDLDDITRQQQLGQGWFDSMEEVPSQAISMTIYGIMKASNVILSVFGEHKSDTVRKAFTEPVSPDCPASILQRHMSCIVYLDKQASAKLAK